jgi:hypothetical protein
VVSDLDPQAVGIFTGGIQEADCLAQADLMVMVGLDPVEMILQPWPYNKPAVELSNATHDVHYIKPLARVSRDLKQHALALNEALKGYVSGWSLEQITLLRHDILKRLAYPPVQFGVAPDRLVQLSAQVYAEQKFRPRMSVDAGAHMFSATAFFAVTQPGDVLISNGLATMAFALPAAIAAALDEPEQPVICFTGDGGLMMCLGELCTAIDSGARISFGSDWPITDFTPLVALAVPVHRQTPDHQPPQGWSIEQAITIEEAMHFYTAAVAHQLFREADFGTLEVGKVADFIILDRNPIQSKPHDVRDIEVLATYRKGEKVLLS